MYLDSLFAARSGVQLLFTFGVLVRHLVKPLWSLLLLMAGVAVTYQYWPTPPGFIALLISLLLFLPLVIVSLIDARRARSLQSQPSFFEVNHSPPRRLFGGPIASGLDQTVGAVAFMEVLAILLTAIAGIGALGYVGVSWLGHFASHAQYLAASATALLAFLAVGAAFARIPIALVVVFSGAAFCGAAFLSGYGNVLLP